MREEYWQAAHTALGISGEQWISYFAGHPEGETKDHTELARRARQRLDEEAQQRPELHEQNLYWWAQGIAISYEYEMGWRQPAQRCDGTFGASASKTIAGTLDEVLAKWGAFASEHLGEVDGVPWETEPRITSSEKWRYWRCELANGVPVSININAKSTEPGKEKCVLAVEARKLESTQQAQQVKATWKEILGDFAARAKS